MFFLTYFSEILNSDFSIGKNIFPNWFFNFPQLGHFREIFSKIKTKDSCREEYAVFEMRISLLLRGRELCGTKGDVGQPEAIPSIT